MKVEIQDAVALEQIPSSSVLAYLRTHDWHDDGRWGQRGTLYTTEALGRRWDILIPIKDTVPGYARNMFETIRVLASVEERSQIDIYRDLRAAGADVIRLAALGGDQMRAPSLQRSLGLTTSAYGLLQAAARAADHPAAAYSGRPTAQVSEYLDTVRAFPGDFDDYDLAVHSPVPVEVQGNLFPTDPPFPRRVTMTLSRALASTELAVGSAVTNGGLSAFDGVVDSGVSANLCDAVATLAGRGSGVAIDVQWAPIRGRPGSAVDQFRFLPEAAEVLSEARVYLRQREPYRNEEIIGQVVLLARDVGDQEGRAHIIPEQRDLPTPLAAKFGAPEYDRLIEAFGKQARIRLFADIEPEGRGYNLTNPHHLEIIESEQ